MSIYTVGHSTLTDQQLQTRLAHFGIHTLIDVRSHPTSRWPQYQRENLQRWTDRCGIKYVWWPELGGWSTHHACDSDLRGRMATEGVDLGVYARGGFPKQRIGRPVKPADGGTAETGKPVWTNRGLLDYAWFTILPEFQSRAAELVHRSDRVAIMCAELLWWKCHRSMIADYVLATYQADSIHIVNQPVRHSKVIANRLDRYPAAVRETW